MEGHWPAPSTAIIDQTLVKSLVGRPHHKYIHDTLVEVVSEVNIPWSSSATGVGYRSLGHFSHSLLSQCVHLYAHRHTYLYIHVRVIQMMCPTSHQLVSEETVFLQPYSDPVYSWRLSSSACVDVLVWTGRWSGGWLWCSVGGLSIVLRYMQCVFSGGCVVWGWEVCD